MDHAAEIWRQVPTQGATLRLAGAAQKYNRRSLEGFLPLSTLIQSLSPSKRSLVCRTVNLPRYFVHGGRSSPFHEIVKIGTLSQWGYIPTGAAADPEIGGQLANYLVTGGGFHRRKRRQMRPIDGMPITETRAQH